MKTQKETDIKKIIAAMEKIININFWFLLKNINNPAWNIKSREIDLKLEEEFDVENAPKVSKEKLEEMKKEAGLN